MRAATLPSQISGKIYCPSCAKPLGQSPTVDPFAISFSCASSHRFLVAPSPEFGVQDQPATTYSLPAWQEYDRTELATFWLTDPDARTLLNPQLAELLRIILEDTARAEPLTFTFCPLCAKQLSEIDDHDVWVRNLSCPLSHRWGERGGRIGCVFQNVPFSLHAEPTEAVVRKIIRGWLDQPILADQLHDSVRHVLCSSKFAKDAA